MTLAVRRQLAIVSVIAALLAQVGVPALHAIVHRLEVLSSSAPRRGNGWRVEARRSQSATPPGAHHGRDPHGHDHGPTGRHQHPGDRPGRHGAGAPEHLACTLAPAPALPAPHHVARVVCVPRPTPRVSVAAAPVPARDRNRGPPVTA